MTEPVPEPIGLGPVRALVVLTAAVAFALLAAYVVLASLPADSWSLGVLRDLTDVGRTRSLPSWLLAQILLVGALLLARLAALARSRGPRAALALAAALTSLASLEQVAALHRLVPAPAGAFLALAALAFAGVAVRASGARRALLLLGAALLLAGAAAGAGTLHPAPPAAPAEALAPALAAGLALAGALTGVVGLALRLHRKEPHDLPRFA